MDPRSWCTYSFAIQYASLSKPVFSRPYTNSLFEPQETKKETERDTEVNDSAALAESTTVPKPSEQKKARKSKSKVVVLAYSFAPFTQLTSTLARTLTKRASLKIQETKIEKLPELITCNACEKTLQRSKFSKGKVKKWNKAENKGKSRPIVCLACTKSNKTKPQTYRKTKKEMNTKKNSATRHLKGSVESTGSAHSDSSSLQRDTEVNDSAASADPANVSKLSGKTQDSKGESKVMFVMQILATVHITDQCSHAHRPNRQLAGTRRTENWRNRLLHAVN